MRHKPLEIERFCRNVDTLADRKRLSVKQLSEAVGVSRQCINEIVAGRAQDVKLSTACRIAGALGVSLQRMFRA